MLENTNGGSKQATQTLLDSSFLSDDPTLLRAKIADFKAVYLHVAYQYHLKEAWKRHGKDIFKQQLELDKIARCYAKHLQQVRTFLEEKEDSRL